VTLLTVWSPKGVEETAKVVCRHTVLPASEISFCSDRTPEGDVVLAAGKSALELLQIIGACPKNAGIESLRGTVVQTSARKYVLTVDGASVLFQEDAETKLVVDLRMAERIAMTGSQEAKLGKYRYVDDLRGIREEIELRYTLIGQAVPVAVDTETMGLHPWYPDKRMVAVQVSLEVGHADVVYLLKDWYQGQWGRFLQDLDWLLNTPKVRLRGANFKYDVVWFWVKFGIRCTNFKMDTTLVGNVLNENRSNSLHVHTWVEAPELGGYDDDLDRNFDKGRMELVPMDRLLPYAGGDADAVNRVADKFTEQLLNDPPLANLYVNLLHPAARAWEDLEIRGVVVDLDKYKQLDIDLEEAIADLEVQMEACLPNRLKARHKGQISFSRPSLVQDFLFSPAGLNLIPKVLTSKKKIASVAYKDHLSMFGDHPEAGSFVKLYGAWGQAKKIRSTYVSGFLDHLRPDGRFHPTYMLFRGKVYDQEKDEGGARTGRTSAKNPAVQTIPKRGIWAKRLRDCFTAPLGWLVWSADYEQGELRIVATISNDPTMLQVYRTGGDLHVTTAARFSGMTVDELLAMKATDSVQHDLIRYKGKAGNFGLIYEMAAPGFQTYVRKEYDLLISLQESDEWINGFFALYPGLKGYHRYYKEMAHEFGYVRCPLGRKRHLPLINSPNGFYRGHAERQAINAPIQTTLSEMTQLAVARIAEEIDPERLTVNLMVHDDIVGYVREDSIGLVRDVAEIMYTLPFDKFGWNPSIDFPAEPGVGLSLASLEDLI